MNTHEHVTLSTQLSPAATPSPQATDRAVASRVPGPEIVVRCSTAIEGLYCGAPLSGVYGTTWWLRGAGGEAGTGGEPQQWPGAACQLGLSYGATGSSASIVAGEPHKPSTVNAGNIRYVPQKMTGEIRKEDCTYMHLST